MSALAGLATNIIIVEKMSCTPNIEGQQGGGDVLGRPQTQRKLDRSNRDWQRKSRNLVLKVGHRKKRIQVFLFLNCKFDPIKAEKN